jgi:mono/diheme cytochrome c family protein
MASRLAGLDMRYAVGGRIAGVRAWSRRRTALIGGVVVLLGVLAACSSTNTYPIDYFSEMHYQVAYKSLEPPRFGSVEGAVPTDGRAPEYAPDQIVQLENPVPADDASIARGLELFQVNCAVCHGEQGDGQGLIVPHFEANGAPRLPADLTADRMVQVADNHFYNIVTNGLPPLMPPFGDLIPGDDIWHLVNYIRTLQGQ